MVAAVTMLSPQTAAKPAQPATPATARPPGKRPSQTLAARKRSRLTPVTEHKSPMIRNMGMTQSTNEDVVV